MSWDFDKILSDARQELSSVSDSAGLEQYRIKYLGKKGLCSQAYAALATLPNQEKPLFGKRANELRQEITALFEGQKGRLSSPPSKGSRKRPVDVTLPGTAGDLGTRHILTTIVEEICDIFQSLGFIIHESPEIETEEHNFSSLNIPVDHPSRDAFDTFYLHAPDPTNKVRSLLLRSHTSPGQIRIMKETKPPLAVVIPGTVYRPDAVDASHSFMFHQIEGLLVDKNITFAHLKGLMGAFCRKFFGNDIDMRFRPHFFPFTEPSAEVDIRWKGGKKEWLEIMGCGLVHPNVFDAVHYPKGKHSGFAFGMGVERMAMLKHGIKDIRIFYENDVRFLRQF